jgi:hypothetical protein
MNRSKFPVKIFSFIWIALLALVSTATHAPTAAQGPPPAKPSTEMDRLKSFYLGTWDYTETYEKSAFSPQGSSDSGIYTSEPGPGGNSIVNRFHSHGEAGDFDGLLVITWNPKEKAYKSYVFGNGFPGCIVQTGNFEGEALIFRADFESAGMNLKLRNVSRPAGNGKIVSEEFIASEGAPEVLLVSVEAKKRP